MKRSKLDIFIPMALGALMAYALTDIASGEWFSIIYLIVALLAFIARLRNITLEFEEKRKDQRKREARP